MTIETKTRDIYITTDKQEFDDQDNALAHQALLDNDAEIAAFVETLDNKPRFKASAARILREYVQWKAVQ